MEDVWEGINNLTSLNDHTSNAVKFQDFLPPHPVTTLTLSTRSDFHFHPPTHKDLQLPQPHHTNASKLQPFLHPFVPKVALLSGDTRNARLMKNRESAARSRARKQENIASFRFSIAYLFELKQKIKHLKEENARLRKQHQLVRFSYLTWLLPLPVKPQPISRRGAIYIEHIQLHFKYHFTAFCPEPRSTEIGTYPFQV
ncbi:hypothetical protein VNO78_34999 [Psophocarpus tetragonolobus]|uniref:BZIP domain-containing protein n=1 Tax=Psophocarpus tetragonolobus TaxID=3891 RepID=A0AAN9RH52_PSOTE